MSSIETVEVMTHEPTPADTLEQSLRQLIEQDIHPLGAIAEAMYEDGYAESTAWLLAALATVRYSPAALTDALDRTPLQDALWQVVRSLPAARQAAMAPRTAAAPVAPSAIATRRHDGRELRLRASGSLPEFALLDGVLSDAECEGLIDLARAGLTDSRVMDPAADVVDRQARSCRDCVLRDDGESTLLSTVEARIAELLVWPVYAMERMQVICYRPGESFQSHWDYFDKPDTPLQQTLLQHAGQRVATILLYLSDAPDSATTDFEVSNLRIVPRRGSALYFRYQLPDGSPDPTSLHSGQQLVRGEKWVASLWLRERRVRMHTT